MIASKKLPQTSKDETVVSADGKATRGYFAGAAQPAASSSSAAHQLSPPTPGGKTAMQELAETSSSEDDVAPLDVSLNQQPADGSKKDKKPPKAVGDDEAGELAKELLEKFTLSAGIEVKSAPVSLMRWPTSPWY